MVAPSVSGSWNMPSSATSEPSRSNSSSSRLESARVESSPSSDSSSRPMRASHVRMSSGGLSGTCHSWSRGSSITLPFSLSFHISSTSSSSWFSTVGGPASFGGVKRRRDSAKRTKQGADRTWYGTGQAAVGEHGTWYGASSGRRMYRRQFRCPAGVPRSTGEAAAAKWSGSLRSKVGRPPPARGAPVVDTAHKVCAREFHARALQRRLTFPPAAVDGSVDGLRRARGGRASLAPALLGGGADGVTKQRVHVG
eukprot:scaffold50058_cov60-Phaeocystis_antarctica.AAC.2